MAENILVYYLFVGALSEEEGEEVSHHHHYHQSIHSYTHQEMHLGMDCPPFRHRIVVQKFVIVLISQPFCSLYKLFLIESKLIGYSIPLHSTG